MINAVQIKLGDVLWLVGGGWVGGGDSSLDW